MPIKLRKLSQQDHVHLQSEAMARAYKVLMPALTLLDSITGLQHTDSRYSSFDDWLTASKQEIESRREAFTLFREGNV